MSVKRYAVILGARPNFVKAAPFFLEAKKHPEFSWTVIHTGQHFDPNMSKIFFDQMGIPMPDIHLDIKGGAHTEKIGKMFHALKIILTDGNFDGVIVFGDVNSTLAGAIAAVKGGARLIHIEAGLRSHDRRMPEEINRVIVDHLSDVLFTTEPSANENLRLEGVPSDRIHYVGNLMMESLERFQESITGADVLPGLGLTPKGYVVSTIHRQENTDAADQMRLILEMLNQMNRNDPIVLPLHPGTKKRIEDHGLTALLHPLKVIEPLGYFEFLHLISRSKGVVTDSGGIQEETTHLGVPCCTLRDNTERPITVEQGSNILFPISMESMTGILAHLDRTDFKSRQIPLWDQDVSKRIFEVLNAIEEKD